MVIISHTIGAVNMSSDALFLHLRGPSADLWSVVSPARSLASWF